MAEKYYRIRKITGTRVPKRRELIAIYWQAMEGLTKKVTSELRAEGSEK